MAKDSEKRFDSIMDRLFYAPKSSPSSTSSSSGGQASRGKKRPNPSSALALVEHRSRSFRDQGFRHFSAPASPSQAPVCRPWDRGDLMKRVATFKSMTWFAKPKVVSALNCARRGWVNIDVDTLSCESCRARLLFSTPASWNQQQVEKAALVFSLKLDNGHKILCPWVDNACDEKLSEFPPTPPPVLVDKFRERCSEIIQLPVLPVISPSAIDYMKSPQLDQLLGQSSMFYGNGSADISQIEHPDNEGSADSAKLYYQAQKLISLCGWEPRSLPYIVDSENRLNHSTRKAIFSSPSHIASNSHYPIINVQSASNHDSMEASENSSISTALQSESSSVVLDCKLCGASVGLWAFTTVPRPVELFQLVGYAEVSSETHSGTIDSSTESHLGSRRDGISAGSDAATPSKDKFQNLQLTIAGGPRPTKQNFKATISLPVIGRNLRARFSYNSELKDCFSASQEDMQSDSQIENLLQGSNPEDVGNVDLENSIVRDHDANNTYKGGEDNNNSVVMASSNGNLDSGTVVEHSKKQESSCVPSSLEPNADPQHSLNHEGIVDKVQIPVNNELVASNTGKDLRHASPGGTMEFDSIKQHRHFCPWIASTGNGAPGWKQTLTALQRQEGCSSSSASTIKVDDPITSIRNLFTSPSPKRMKRTVLTTGSPQQ